MPRFLDARRRHAKRILRGWAGIGLSLLLQAGQLTAQDTEKPGPGKDLYLEVFINGRPLNLITRFTDLGNGVLSADAQELRNSGILSSGVATTGEVRLDQIPGLGWRLIEPEQTIRFIVPDGLMAPHVLDAGNAQGDGWGAEDGQSDRPPIDHGYGLVLNYGLTFDSWKPRDGAISQNVAASFDTRMFMPLGALTHGFALTDAADKGLQHRRLDTYWRSSFPGRATQVQIGDIATRGPGWSRPVRMGGLMVERNFGLRPDLVTLPLPGFEGSAALPSTVEVFADSIRTYSGDVPAGPFRIDDLPLSGGAGMARVIVRDVTGRETQMDLPFLVSEDLLRRGTIDFAVAAGRPRLGIGTETDHYAEGTYGVGTLRFGATDSLTLLAHAEAGPGLVMAGLGATFRVAHLGTVSMNMAQSRADRGDGRLIDLSTALSFGKTRLSGRVLATSGNFTDIAALTADPELAHADLSEFPRRLIQLSYTVPLSMPYGTSANLFVSDMEYAGKLGERSIGASYSRPLWGDASLTLTALNQRGSQNDSVFGAQFHMPLGERRDISALAERNRRGWRHYVSASGRSETSLPGWNWRLQADRSGDRTGFQGNFARDGKLGRVEVAGSTLQGNSGIGLRLDGAVVVAGGGVFLSRRVDDAFAVVDVGAPDVEVMAENRSIGRTGRSGKILVPDLRAYEDNLLTIDPANLPLDAAVGATSHTVRPAHHAGTKVDFGVQASAQEALIELIDAQGQPLEVGGRVLVNGADDDLLVGFDGEVFVLGLQARNQIEVSYPDGRICTATLDYDDQPGTLNDIRGVPCR